LKKELKKKKKKKKNTLLILLIIKCLLSFHIKCIYTFDIFPLKFYYNNNLYINIKYYIYYFKNISINKIPMLKILNLSIQKLQKSLPIQILYWQNLKNIKLVIGILISKL